MKMTKKMPTAGIFVAVFIIGGKVNCIKCKVEAGEVINYSAAHDQWIPWRTRQEMKELHYIYDDGERGEWEEIP